jgi:hypothetical protein
LQDAPRQGRPPTALGIIDALLEEVLDTDPRLHDVTGSVGDDLLVGDANANVLIGGTGRNVIIGGGGGDTIVGGGRQHPDRRHHRV